MSIWKKLRNSLWQAERQSTEIEEELAFHLEAKIRDLEQAGHTRREAMRLARQQVGSTMRFVDETSDQGRLAWVGDLWRDAKVAVRNLQKRPGLVATAMLSMGLGLGANAAIFSVVDAALFRPLPLREPDRLVILRDSAQGTSSGGNAARLYDFAEQLQSVETVAGFYGEGATLTGQGEAERLNVLRTYGPFLRLLGTSPQLGRAFTADEEQGRGERTVLLTDTYWRKRFQADRSIIGQSVQLNKVNFLVTGVLPADLTFPEGFEAISPADAELQNRGNRRARYLDMLARLKPGVTRAVADAELAGVNGRLANQYPDTDKQLVTTTVSVQEEITKEARGPLLLLLGTAGFVLLIACVNLSNLLLARASERRHEAAIRASLGAGTWRLVQLYLVESFVLALAGGATGWWAASVLLPVLQEILPAELPRLAYATLDLRVFGVSLAVTLLCGLIFGSLPALHLARHSSLVSSTRATAGASTLLTRRMLVAVQMALSIVLLVAVGLLGRGLLALQQRPLGFVAESVWTAKVDFPWTTDGSVLHQFSASALEKLAALPGVESVGLTDRLPLEGGSQDNPIRVVGRTLSPELEKLSVAMRAVSENYLATMKVPLRAGRWFREPALEAVVNETFARTFFPAGDALGSYFAGQRDKKNKEFLIVGIVPDVRRQVSPPRPYPEVFLSHKVLYWPMLRFAVRGRTDGSALREVFRQIDPNIVVGSVAPMETRVREATGEARTQLGIVFAFAFLALGLAAVGLYGVLASDVAQRRRELGIRLALGAAPNDLLSQIVSGGVKVTFWGLVPGLLLAVGLARLAKDRLPGVDPSDWIALLAASGLLLLVAATASYLPARRAARVDPLQALRQE